MALSKTNGLFEYMTFRGTDYIKFRGELYLVRDMSNVDEEYTTCSMCRYNKFGNCTHPVRDHIYTLRGRGELTGVRNAMLYCNPYHNLAVREEV